jgi:hypothetical protein
MTSIFFGESPLTCHFPPVHPFLGTERVGVDLKRAGGCGIAPFCEVLSWWIVCIHVGSTGQVRCHCHHITDACFHCRDTHQPWSSNHLLSSSSSKFEFLQETHCFIFPEQISEMCCSTKTRSVTMSTQWVKEGFILSFLTLILKLLGLQGKAPSMYFKVFGSCITWNYFLWLVTQEILLDLYWHSECNLLFPQLAHIGGELLRYAGNMNTMVSTPFSMHNHTDINLSVQHNTLCFFLKCICN